MSRTASTTKKSSPDEPSERNGHLDYLDLTANDLGAVALEMLDELENLRAGSKNLQGRVSGRMKRNIEELREVLRAFTMRGDLVREAG